MGFAASPLSCPIAVPSVVLRQYAIVLAVALPVAPFPRSWPRFPGLGPMLGNQLQASVVPGPGRGGPHV